MPKSVLKVGKTAVHQVRKSAMSLSPTLLETIIRDQKIEADEYTLFRILEAWSNATTNEVSHNSNKSGETLDRTESQRTERREAARQTTNHLHFVQIVSYELGSI
jgi:hypothetical protein